MQMKKSFMVYFFSLNLQTAMHQRQSCELKLSIVSCDLSYLSAKFQLSPLATIHILFSHLIFFYMIFTYINCSSIFLRPLRRCWFWFFKPLQQSCFPRAVRIITLTPLLFQLSLCSASFFVLLRPLSSFFFQRVLSSVTCFLISRDFPPLWPPRKQTLRSRAKERTREHTRNSGQRKS